MLLYEPVAGVTVDTLEDELTKAFAMIRATLDRGEAVVVSLEERNLQGRGELGDVALTHGLLGLARALAVEGRKPGWRIAVLSTPAHMDPEERLTWIEHLAESGAATGALVRLGGDHLGKVPV